MVAAVLGARPFVNESTYEDDSDEALVRRAKRGDTRAFAELVRRNQGSVYGLAYRFMGEPASAEDMAQEAFLKGFRLLKGFRGDCQFSTWMYRVTSSVCLTELAKRKKRGEVALDKQAEHGYEDDSAELHDRRALVRECVESLPERYATIVTMYYLQQLPYEEIAAAMDIPIGTLKTWMFRARKQLRAKLEEVIGDDAAELV